MNIVKELEKHQLIKPPRWLSENINYLTMMGSIAYQVSGDMSDVDVYGFCIPQKEVLFPHLTGYFGFGKAPPSFDQFQQHHVKHDGRSYDITVYNIVKYFNLCAENNPNMVDSLYTPQSCVLSTTKVGNIVRDARDKFLHKGCYHKFRGYAFSQLDKAASVRKDPLIKWIREFEQSHRDIPHSTTLEEAKVRENFPQLHDWAWKEYVEKFEQGVKQSKRFESWKRFNTDVKFLYHLARLMDECEQILTLGTLDLSRSKEYLKAIRRGEVSEDELRSLFTIKEKELTKVYNESPLRYSPDYNYLQTLLLNCLEEHYGSLSNCIVTPDADRKALLEIRDILNKYRV